MVGGDKRDEEVNVTTKGLISIGTVRGQTGVQCLSCTLKNLGLECPLDVSHPSRLVKIPNYGFSLI